MNSDIGSILVVTPVYEDVEASTMLFEELGRCFGNKVYVIAVDDGSVKLPLDTAGIQAAGLNGKVLKLRRNVGHQRAIAIGLGYASEHIRRDQTIVIMDSDGEDQPSTIPDLVDGLKSDTVDVVVAQRLSRVETFRFKAFYAIYKRLFRIMTGRPISFGNFMAMKPAAAKRLVSMPELTIHVAGSVLASKLRTGVAKLHRGPRYSGQSKMNFVGLVLHGFKALMVFAEDVLVRVGIACSIIAGLSVTGTIIAIILKIIGFSTPGWFSVALGILMLIFLQTGALALMTLMLTGVVRGGTIANALDYENFIEEVLEVKQPAEN